jgi:hypothetical protein
LSRNTKPSPLGEDRSPASSRIVRQSTVPKLPAPVTPDADDQTLLDQVIDYYHATLKQSPEALAYLDRRGIASSEAIARFKLGYANRTLGLRLPEKSRKAGADIRERLQRLGLLRASGHEHFNGSLMSVVTIIDGVVCTHFDGLAATDGYARVTASGSHSVPVRA